MFSGLFLSFFFLILFQWLIHGVEHGEGNLQMTEVIIINMELSAVVGDSTLCLWARACTSLGPLACSSKSIPL